jgi:hypothetical protein
MFATCTTLKSSRLPIQFIGEAIRLKLQRDEMNLLCKMHFKACISINFGETISTALELYDTEINSFCIEDKNNASIMKNVVTANVHATEFFTSCQI